MTNHQAPSKNPMSAAQLMALFADPERHPKALNHELKRAPITALNSLFFGETSVAPVRGVPDALALLAHAELKRRQTAQASLLAEVARIRASVPA